MAKQGEGKATGKAVDSSGAKITLPKGYESPQQGGLLQGTPMTLKTESSATSVSSLKKGTKG
ncbi:MAG TPA: hypothetical protein VNA25_10285 [Phycisphaerae bacterium]|nr:hypothetical protein [Phycisphaerae bacterium]